MTTENKTEVVTPETSGNAPEVSSVTARPAKASELIGELGPLPNPTRTLPVEGKPSVPAGNRSDMAGVRLSRPDANAAPVTKKRGRPSNADKAAGGNNPVTPSATKKPSKLVDPRTTKTGTVAVAPYDPKTPDNYDASAGVYLDIGTGVLAGITQNDEFKFDDEKEREMLRVPLAGVLREKQMADLSPTQLFCAALATFLLSRLARPKTSKMVNKWLGIEEVEKDDPKIPGQEGPTEVPKIEKIPQSADATLPLTRGELAKIPGAVL
jgi:hypothetical protein